MRPARFVVPAPRAPLRSVASRLNKFGAAAHFARLAMRVKLSVASTVRA